MRFVATKRDIVRHAGVRARLAALARSIMLVIFGIYLSSIHVSEPVEIGIDTWKVVGQARIIVPGRALRIDRREYGGVGRVDVLEDRHGVCTRIILASTTPRGMRMRIGVVCCERWDWLGSCVRDTLPHGLIRPGDAGTLKDVLVHGSQRHVAEILESRRHTKRGVLKRKGNNVPDPFNRHREGVTREALTDDNLDAAKIVRGTPVVLLEQLLTKVGEFQGLEIAVLREFCDVVSKGGHPQGESARPPLGFEGLTKAMRKNMRPARLAVERSRSCTSQPPLRYGGDREIYAMSRPSTKRRAWNMTESRKLVHDLVNCDTFGGFQECMETWKGVPAAKLGTKQHIVGTPGD